MNEIRVAQTFYRGTYYRSRIEARWAVFFDVLGLKHEYEQEKFELSSGRYIPDFLVYGGKGCTSTLSKDSYWEVKGAEPDLSTVNRFIEFNEGVHYSGGICCGPIQNYLTVPITTVMWMERGIMRNEIHPGYLHRWVQCPFCGKFGLALWNVQSPMDVFCCSRQEEILRRLDIICYGFVIEPPVSPSIKLAISTAQSARFEDINAIEKIVQNAANNVALLTSSGVIYAPDWMARVNAECVRISKDPGCPTFAMENGIHRLLEVTH